MLYIKMLLIWYCYSMCTCPNRE